MRRYDWDGWRPYVPVAERRRRATATAARLRKDGQQTAPVRVSGRRITGTFWGDAWCGNLEAYSDFANRLPRGRTYVRNGSVIDLQIETGRVRALVSGSDLYEIEIGMKPLDRKRWSAIKAACSGELDSLIELLRGSISSSVMEIVTRKGEGLFPAPREITLSCSCPDWAAMCKHVAATLYGVGARLDHQPELLFALRGVDPVEMVEAATEQPHTGAKRGGSRVLAADQVSAVFGVDLEMGEVDVAPARRARPPAARGKGRRKTSRSGKKPADRAASGRSTPRPKKTVAPGRARGKGSAKRGGKASPGRQSGSGKTAVRRKRVAATTGRPRKR
jgi:uncharacterized Zn finger protein